jgi:predicted RNase H-like nuclease (RuvC/YqgF family)
MSEPMTEKELEMILYGYRTDDNDRLVRRFVAEIRRLRELQEKADREIARLKAKNEELQRRDDYVTGCMA